MSKQLDEVRPDKWYGVRFYPNSERATSELVDFFSKVAKGVVKITISNNIKIDLPSRDTRSVDYECRFIEVFLNGTPLVDYDTETYGLNLYWLIYNTIDKKAEIITIENYKERFKD